MYRIPGILLIFLISGLAFAQDDTVIMPDDLPDPVFTTEGNIIFYADPHQFAWLDNETLVFTPYNQRTEGWEDLARGYQYNLTTNTLIDLDSSPFHITMPEEYREWYQVGLDEIIHRQPYLSSNDIRSRILYHSSIHNRANRFIMTGVFDKQTDDEPTYVIDSYAPIHINDSNFHTIFWGRTDIATVQVGATYGQGDIIYYLDFQTLEATHLPYGLFQTNSDRVLAMSDDGNYVTFSSHSNDDVPQAIGQNLYIWRAPYHDELCACTYDAQIEDMIAPVNPNAPGEVLFAGVGFVDEDTILYIGELGLMRHNLLTGISTPLDRELNVGWIRTAIFSPDLEHVAITTEQGLYVLETFAPDR